MAGDNQIDVTGIQNGWEQYLIKTVENPVKGIKRALIIAGCDRRGTAYGTFALRSHRCISSLLVGGCAG